MRRDSPTLEVRQSLYCKNAREGWLNGHTTPPCPESEVELTFTYIKLKERICKLPEIQSKTSEGKIRCGHLKSKYQRRTTLISLTNQ